MDDTEQPRTPVEIADDIRKWQDNLQGQLGAVTRAICSLLRQAGPGAPLVAQTLADMEAWRMMMTDQGLPDPAPLAELEGFDSVLRQMRDATARGRPESGGTAH